MSVDTQLSEHVAHDPATFDEVQVLAQRLERGWTMIERRQQAGQDVTTLERHWLRLLDEYEQLCNLRAAKEAPIQAD